MIYECPSCRTPQEAGQTVCPNCHAQFDGPVPADAVIPPPLIVKTAAPEADIAAETVPAEPGSAEPGSAEPNAAEPNSAEPNAGTGSPAETAPPLIEVKPPPVSVFPHPATSEPYLGTSAFPPPTYEQANTVSASPPQPLARLSRMLLIALPLVLLLVLGAVFYANSLYVGSDTLPVSLPIVRSSVPTAIPAAPVGTPTVLQGGGSSSSTSQDPRADLLAGRWVARSGEFYLFNSNGTGSHGNPVQQKPDQSFLWGLSQNRLMLYEDQNVPLRFNQGPDNSTIFLAAPSGHYVQFSRSKT